MSDCMDSDWPDVRLYGFRLMLNCMDADGCQTVWM